MGVVSYIDSGWSFTQLKGSQEIVVSDWLPTSSFPTTVHVELIKRGIIPDPFLELNEHKVQWVGEADWIFKCSFDITEEQMICLNADLVFEGLDTHAIVELNGQKILQSNNQFLPYHVPVKGILKLGTNDILITFENTWTKGKLLEKEHGKFSLWNGDSSRLHVRKSQYNYGWDWGPVLLTVGPWRPIYLHTYATRISDLRLSVDVSDKLETHIEIALTASSSIQGLASIVIRGPAGKVVRTVEANLSNGLATFAFDGKEDEFALWWPVGYGDQPLYVAEVILKNEKGAVLDSKIQTFGIRRVRVIQEPLIDQEGRSFLFEINNVRIFIGGSNWIPADSFLTTLNADIYRSWIQLAVDGNQNMLRVWGGGIYEEDSFYDICDELGVLVWQDFMFGCGQYPAYDDFLDRLVPEVEENVKRLRHHPSIVIFAGNNEDYQLAESLNLQLDYNDDDPKTDLRKTNFPARHIYERVLPEITAKLSDIHYHRSSPYSGFGKVTTDLQHGDLHQWNVWHGSQETWHNWDTLAGRFVSEFGMEGYPNIRTIDFWLNGNSSQRYPQSRIMNSHNKADGCEARIEHYLVENFKHTFDMETYLYYTQLMQAETLASAYRMWRRNWKGPGREYTAGALVWQINDCWPVTSWSIVDYFLRPKPAYFAIARELRTITVGMTRKEIRTPIDDITAANYTISTVLQVWGTNSSLAKKGVTVEVTAFDLHSDWKESFSRQVTLLPNQSTEVFDGPAPGVPQRSNVSDGAKTIILSARIVDKDGSILARHANWPEPFKFIDFPSEGEVDLRIAPTKPTDSLLLTSKKPIKGIIIEVDGEDVKWSDQSIDLFPGDPQIISALGLSGRKVTARYLGDSHA